MVSAFAIVDVMFSCAPKHIVVSDALKSIVGVGSITKAKLSEAVGLMHAASASTLSVKIAPPFKISPEPGVYVGASSSSSEKTPSPELSHK